MDHNTIAAYSQFSEDLRNQRLRAVELLQYCPKFSEAARKLGTTEAELRRLLDKHNEIETAKRFLESTQLLTADIRTLKEFAGIDSCPSTNRDLDYVCPDVVAVAGRRAIGIELTAYRGDESENRLFNIRCQVNRVAREEFSGNCGELKGCHIFWDPKEENVLRKVDVRAFTKQLLGFVQAKQRESPFSRDEKNDFPPYWTATRETPFKDWSLLNEHASRVRVYLPSGLSELPVSVSPGSSTSCRGTSTEIIHRTVQKKINSLKNAYRKDISNNWLLIHATRNPISSDIYPLFPQEIERLLGSEAGLLAKQSEYKRVILWDGVDGGYVDLKSDDFSAVEI